MRENQNAHVECNACASACVAPLCVYVYASRAETFVGHVERFEGSRGNTQKKYALSPLVFRPLVSCSRLHRCTSQ